MIWWHYFPRNVMAGALAMLATAAVCAWFAYRYGDGFWRNIWT